MNRFRVAVTDFIADDLLPENEQLHDIADVIPLDAKRIDDVIPRLGEFHALMAFHKLLWHEPALSQMRHLKILVRCGVGYDNVDVKYARQIGLDVANVPDYGNEEIADSAIGLMLSLVRGIHLFNQRLQRGEGPWNHTPGVPTYRLRGRVFGVVGCGNIGTASALRAKALGMNVVFFDPYKPAGYDKALGIRRAETLEELLEQAFVVSPHCLLIDETRHLIDAEAIARMPRGSFLVNTSRGAVVDTAAIPAAIESGHLAGAGFDVLPEEPPAENDPLITAWRNPTSRCHDRVIINPHAAFYSEEGLREMRTKAAQTVRRALLGQPVRTIVNKYIYT